MKKTANPCSEMAIQLPPYFEGSLPPDQRAALEKHLAACVRCRNSAEEIRAVNEMLCSGYAGSELSPNFRERTEDRMRSITAQRAPVEDAAEFLPELNSRSRWSEVLGSTPWWAVSVAMHVLVVLLAGLISMSIEVPRQDDALITVTELAPRPKVSIEEEQRREPAKSALASKQETPPTDPTSQEMNNIIVPPEILAKAVLGDHFETVNPDRPDTQSAFGNPDAQMFHSVQGNDEPEGGGGAGGSSLEDMIGVGGAASPGSGGGWGGGHGTGIGAGNGSGRGSFGSRNGGGRVLMVKRHGGSKKTEGAVEKALEWLARNQEADGHWDGRKHGAGSPGDTALTGLATLAFLGAGHTEKIGKYKDNVLRAVKWLIAAQDAQGRVMKAGDGSNAGYNHPIAALALAEAAGMARIPETMAAAQSAVDYTINIHQQGEGSEKLGWRYSPKEMGDVSTTGWFIMQLKSAKVAGLKVDVMALEGALKYLDTIMVEKRDPKDPYSGHRYGYRADGPGGAIRVKNPHCNTAIGCLGQLFLGTPPHEVQGGVEWFVKQGGVPTAAKPEFYHWYYATLCTFQTGGEVWRQWNEGLKTALLAMQCQGGANDGSWDPKGHSTEGAEGAGGRVFTTALGAMCLEVYYRYQQLNAR